MISFELPITVTAADLDELNHVNNVVYVQWVQDAAKAHWEKIASMAVKEKYVWMVLRHEIDYVSQAMLGDQLIAKTWVEWSEGVRSERRVEIRQAGTGKIVIKAATLWCLLDAVTRRPKRIEADITSIFHD
ncbi:MAG TPA: thioesterase family protein [Cyclobacteriaceae bacterium]|nr:thioesterase family protein [Cyclobacteriaceae bacterium]HRW99491.1 thioesterase family protein [Cyclobacteriaceae bacterium]